MKRRKPSKKLDRMMKDPVSMPRPKTEADREKWKTLSPFATASQRMVSALAYQEIALSELGPDLVERTKGDGSLRDLARRSGLSPTYLSLIQRREKEISLETFVRLTKLLFEMNGGFR
jgi:AraC-like DNA-binding protein